jgi:hypothetical protein
VVGGNAVGAALKDYNLGSLGNTIAGALGGVGGGQLLLAAMPAIAGAAGGSLDVGAIISQIVGGGAGRDPHGHLRACEEHGDARADALSTGASRVADQRSC